MDEHGSEEARHYGRPRKYIPTKSTDRIIRNAYLYFRRHGDRTLLKNAAARIGWPRHVVSRRASELGVSAVIRNRPWSKREVVILKRHSRVSAETIRRVLRAIGFHRSTGSIVAEKKRLTLENTGEQYSARQVSLGLGIDPHKVSGWIRRKLLLARRSDDRASHWVITKNSLKDFIFRHPEEIDLAQADKLWLLKVLQRNPKSVG